MKTPLVVQKTWQRIKALPMKQKIWALVLVVIVVCFLIPRGGDTSITPEDAMSRIASANKAQGKLCIMKIDAATCAYVFDDAWYKVLYEVCYTHRSEVDVVIDLTNAKLEKTISGFKVTVPNPSIDEGTVNIIPENLKLWKHFGGSFRSDRAKIKCGKMAEDEICKDLKQTVCDEKIFSMFEARRQAEIVLQSIYAALGISCVEVKFEESK